MANKDNPLGFSPHLDGSGAKPVYQRMTLATSAKVYPGDPVVLSSGLITASGTAISDLVFGIAAGYADQTSGSYVDQDAMVITNLEDVVWRVQMDGAVAEADIGTFYYPLVGTASTTLKQSRFEMDYASKETTCGKTGAEPGRKWELIGKVDEPGNDWGANCDVLVRFRRNLDA